MIYNCSKSDGGIAQLGERLNGIQEVSGSIPLISTIPWLSINKFSRELSREFYALKRRVQFLHLLDNFSLFVVLKIDTRIIITKLAQ